jgi:hypothetical protein
MIDAAKKYGWRRSVALGECTRTPPSRWSCSKSDQQTQNRTANYMHLTDCAFLFFKGLSLRIWDPEIECDLPCHEEVFDAEHPFTHPDFYFSRSLTTQQAFGTLLTPLQSGLHASLTMLDSFVLIHRKPRTTISRV